MVGKIVLCLVVLASALPFSTSVGNEASLYADCLEKEVCFTKGGISKAMLCTNKLKAIDVKFTLDMMGPLFPKANNTMKGLLTVACKDKEGSKKAGDIYFDTRKKKESEFPVDAKKALSECQECMMNIIQNCLVERELMLK